MCICGLTAAVEAGAHTCHPACLYVAGMPLHLTSLVNYSVDPSMFHVCQEKLPLPNCNASKIKTYRFFQFELVNYPTN